LRIRLNGGDGGHKGVRSIADNLKTNLFYRIKIGIGRDSEIPPEEYVLSRFKGDEAKALSGILDRSVDALQTFIEEGAEKAMNHFNR
jgi:peptidyl-tRNA hydrolase, PTH1 family